MSTDDHAALIAVARRWEKLYDEKCAELERLRESHSLAFKAITAYTEACIDYSQRLEERDTQIAALKADNERLRVLVSWIDGMLVDEADHMAIREGIYRAGSPTATETP